MNKKFIKLTPFKMQVLQSFPFIDADFDAVTNYELLCKVVEYLNVTVENVNLLNDDFIALKNSFIELKAYVDNFFDTLDVQEEINNKLDEMAESGELTDIIAQYLGLAGMITFNNVAEMKLAENLVNGSKCATLGYYTANDGGNAFYRIRTVTNEDVVDECTIIALYNNLLVAELIIEDSMNIKCFGVVGDGETDETTLIQKSLNTTNIVCEAGKNYLVSKPIYINHSLNGNNSTFTIPAYDDIDDMVSTGIYIVNDKNLTVENCIFNSSYVTYNQKIPYTTTKILPPILSFVDGSDGSKAISCKVTNTNGHSIQVYGNTVKNILIENCSAIGCGCGVGIEQIAGSDVTPKNITINNFYSECNNSCEITSGSGIVVNNSYFESNGYGRGVVTTNEAYHDTHVDFNGCTFTHTNVDCSEANSRCILIDSYNSVKKVFANFTACIIKGDIANVKTISLSTLCKASFISCEIEGQILLKGESSVELINSILSGSVRNTNIIIMETADSLLDITNSKINITSPTADIWTKGHVNIVNSVIDSSTNTSLTCKDTSNVTIINSTLSKIYNNENLYHLQLINSKLTNDTRFFTNLGSIIGAVNTTADLANIPSSVSNLSMIMLVTSKKVVYKYGNDWYYLDGTIVS